jgi:hypothetical protein
MRVTPFATFQSNDGSTCDLGTVNANTCRRDASRKHSTIVAVPKALFVHSLGHFIAIGAYCFDGQKYQIK